nr:DUF3093 domain-containing protein [Gordonia effusa]
MEPEPTDDTTEDAADDTPVDAGETLFYESGGSWWVVLIGPVLVGVVLGMEISGPGQVHWLVLGIFFVVLTGFSLLQVYAARQHTSVHLTERTLRQGTKTMNLDDIAKIYPENNATEHKDWESAPALGELSGVPRRRKGIGVKLESGKVAQAWARDGDRFRSELTQAWQAVKMGL